MAPGQPDLCRAGFVLTNAKNVRLNNVQVFDQIGPAVSVTNARDVTLNEISSPTLEEAEASGAVFMRKPLIAPKQPPRRPGQQQPRFNGLWWWYR